METYFLSLPIVKSNFTLVCRINRSSFTTFLTFYASTVTKFLGQKGRHPFNMRRKAFKALTFHTKKESSVTEKMNRIIDTTNGDVTHLKIPTGLRIFKNN